MQTAAGFMSMRLAFSTRARHTKSVKVSSLARLKSLQKWKGLTFTELAANESTPDHGLAIDLARELARLHGGELLLVRSIPGWPEFEAIFLLAIVADTE